MNDRRRSEHTRSAHEGTEQTQRIHQPFPPHTDPAYSGQAYPPSYYPGSAPNPNANHPTDQLPRYWLHGQPPPDQLPDEPEPKRPKAPRWLWIAAAAAVLLVAALVIALVIANGTAGKQTEVPPLPAMPSSSKPVPTVPRSTSPSLNTPAPPTDSNEPNPNASQTVEYSVTGDGRAISITYVDNDGTMQTEFNVALPWSKEVTLPTSGGPKPNITIFNIGHDVTCSLTVDGVPVTQRTGVGLTVCNGSS